MKVFLKNILLLIGLFSSFISYGSYEIYAPTTVKQPNGKELNIFFSGDEFYNWLHDNKGYTIVMDTKSRYYCYAILENDSLIASKYIVGEVSPESVDLLPDINISNKKMSLIANEYLKYLNDQQSFSKKIKTKSVTTSNTLNNIIIYIRFADDYSEFPAEQALFTTTFNGTTSGTSTMRNYFREVSYNQLDISTTFYPANNGTNIISYQDCHIRDYYKDVYYAPDSGYTSFTIQIEREKTLVQNTINYVKNEVINSGLNLDYNNDGYVDNICLIAKGSSLGKILSAHTGFMNGTCDINGALVDSYNFLMESAITSILGPAVDNICHEMFHSLGERGSRPKDLYHTTRENLPVGSWDLMSYPPNPPVHMSTYSKCEHLGWINNIPEITTSGTYTLNPITSSTNNCYKISITGDENQYFVLEYRRKTGIFEGNIDGSGLLIYRINELYSTTGNYFFGSGPGGLIGDEVFIFRKDGTPTVEGDIHNANLSSNVNRTEFHNDSNPKCFILGGVAGNVYIKNISSAGSTISFDIRFCDDEDLVYSNTNSLPGLSNGSNSISTSGTVVVLNGDNVTFEAGNEVILNGGFEVQTGGIFEARIGGCGNP